MAERGAAALLDAGGSWRPEDFGTFLRRSSKWQKTVQAMSDEHTKAADSHDEFTTGNYGVTTTPAIEWSVEKGSLAVIRNL